MKKENAIKYLRTLGSSTKLDTCSVTTQYSMWVVLGNCSKESGENSCSECFFFSPSCSFHCKISQNRENSLSHSKYLKKQYGNTAIPWNLRLREKDSKGMRWLFPSGFSLACHCCCCVYSSPRLWPLVTSVLIPWALCGEVTFVYVVFL